MATSNAIQNTAIARASGYILGYKDVSKAGKYLPQRVALFTPIATSKVAGFVEADYHRRHEITDLKSLHDLCGVCPGYFMTRILRPLSGGGLGTIPLDVFPIKDASGGATAAAGSITPVGTATANATHIVKFNGRSTIDGRQASFSVETGDTAEDVAEKIVAAIQGMIYAPVSAADYDGVAATGSIEIESDIADGDTVTIQDGEGTTVVFEADSNSSVTPGNVAFLIGVSEIATANNLRLAIIASALEITPDAAGAAEINLTNDNTGTAGNIAITQTGDGMAVTGMSGGLAGTARVDLTAKWKGTTGNQITISIEEVDDIDAGMTYTLVQPTGATGTHDANVQLALANFGTVWDTIVINPFGSEIFDTLEDFNGAPDETTGGTGRWSSLVMKPFVAIFGTNSSVKATLKAFATSRESDMTNRAAVAPNSPNASWEIAASAARMTATIYNNAPHRTTATYALPDIIGPDDELIGDMSQYAVRDELIKAGISTVTFTAGAYYIEDTCMFRRPASQDPMNIDFKWERDILLDMNVYYNYLMKVIPLTMDKTIIPDDVVTNAEGCVRPRDVKAAIFDLADALTIDLALVANPQTVKDTADVSISGSNPRRINASFRYERTQCASQFATTAYASYYFG